MTFLEQLRSAATRPDDADLPALALAAADHIEQLVQRLEIATGQIRTPGAVHVSQGLDRREQTP